MTEHKGMRGRALHHLDTPTIIRRAFEADEMPLGALDFFRALFIDFVRRVTNGELVWR